MCIVIEKEGIFSSIQGLGTYGSQRFGINPRGAMDRAAVRIINVLLGNPQDLSTLELHFPAGAVRFTERCLFALGGADFSAELDGQPIDNWRTYFADPGHALSFKKRTKGSRCYLAVKSGLTSCPPGLEPATDELTTIRSVKGSQLFPKVEGTRSDALEEGRRVSSFILPPYSPFPTVRFLPGGEYDQLNEINKSLLAESSFEVSAESNRMGFRLKGPGLALAEPVELVSAAVNFGTMQLLPDGQMIVLMADHQTSGGYPRIGNIISADLPLLGQLGAGDKVAFTATSIEEAERAALALEADLCRLELGVRFGRYW
jgi:antagonist of KipI